MDCILIDAYYVDTMGLAHIKVVICYFLTPWSRVLLEKLTGFAAIKKFPAFYGTRKFITVLTSARQGANILLLLGLIGFL